MGTTKARGKIFSINISEEKGTAKHPVTRALLIEGKGIHRDAHSGVNSNRQVSLLAREAIAKQGSFKPGAFAENITTANLGLSALKVGDKLAINNTAILEVSQIGKVCHAYCEIFKKTGNCIMPKQGIFAKVVKGGKISVGDPLTISRPRSVNRTILFLGEKEGF